MSMEFKKWFFPAKKEIVIPPVQPEEPKSIDAEENQEPLVKQREKSVHRNVESFSTAFLKLREQREQLNSIEMRPRVGILTDRDKIENQQIDIIDAGDIGYYQVTFKLTESYLKKILKKFKDLRRDVISYGKLNETDEYQKYNLVEALILNVNEIIIRISTGGGAYGDQIMSSLGVVQIEIPKEKITDPKDIENQIVSIFQSVLGISGGLEAPDQEAEQQYKLARYSWHHKKSDLSLEEAKLVNEKLTREEVFPGYYTFVDNGKHKEYEATSPYVIYHELWEVHTLSKIIKAGGLMATHERYRRGFIFNGMSSSTDIARGGGDSVFTRTATMAGVENRQKSSGSFRLCKRPYLIFRPSLFDRTDWYAYNDDNYGKTDPDFFNLFRESPQELFEKQAMNEYGLNMSNEQMFRLGISTKDIKAVVAMDIDQALRISDTLKKDNITEINGIPIEEIIFISHLPNEAIDISMDTNKSALTLARMRRENPEEIEGVLYPNTVNYIKNTKHRIKNLKEFINIDIETIGDVESSLRDTVYVLYRNLQATFFQWRSLQEELANYPDNIKEKYKIIIINNLESILEILPEFMKKVAILSVRKKVIPLEELSEYNHKYPFIKKSIKDHINELREF